MYKIYKIKDYTPNNTKRSLLVPFEDTLDNISTELLKNEGYHLLMKNDELTIFYLDLDKIKIYHDKKIDGDYVEESIEMIQDFFKSIVELDRTDIKFTLSKKPDDILSYHITVPKINSTLKDMHQIIIKMKKFNPLLSAFIDDGVYNDNRLYRLPSQTNKDKPHKHIIINGEYKDFIHQYVPEESFLISNTGQKLTITKKGKISIKHKDIKIINKSTTFATDEQFKIMLDMLDESYLNDYDRWIIITNILKGYDKFKLWDEWSQTSKNYKRNKNYSIWRSTKRIIFDINYLKNITGYQMYKEYNPIQNHKPDKTFNNKYLFDKKIKSEQFDYNDLSKNKKILLQSCTGTGKTTATATHISTYMAKHPNIKLLTIISRKTLGHQLIKSFSENNINIVSYEKENFKLDINYSICINSLLKLSFLTNDDINNYIIYIDEINSFIEHLTNNNNYPDLKKIFSLLIRLIKNCKKLIGSDALISDNVFNLIDIKEGSTIFIKNEFCKFEGVKAHNIKDENTFIEKIENNINNDEYFLFGCDSCETVSGYYQAMIQKFENKKDKFIIITSKNLFEIIDASTQFKNKFVFYSPSITTAVDFSIETPQDVFILIKGRTINPASIYQQTTRTRNIKDVYYYSEAIQQDEIYNNINDITCLYNGVINNSSLFEAQTIKEARQEKYLEELIESTKELFKTKEEKIFTDMCVYIDDNDTTKISNNTFFKLFIYNEYTNDIYKTNTTKHYELILKNNKFILDEEGTKNKLSMDQKELQTNLKEEYNDNIFNSWIEGTTNNIILKERQQLLCLPDDKEILIKYKTLLLDPFELQDHLNINRLFKSDYYIKNKFINLLDKNYNCKIFNNVYTKIKIMREYKNKYNINQLNLNEENIDIKFDEREWKQIKLLFRFKDAPTNKLEIYQTFIQMIKNISTNKIISKKQQMINGQRIYIYNYNKEYIKEQFDISKYYNNNINGYSDELYKILDIENPSVDYFID
jgi:hypothetical protein